MRLSNWQPCVAEEEEDVQGCSPGWGGGILVNLPISCAPLSRGGSQAAKPIPGEHGGGWVASRGSQLPHDAALLCQINWLGKYRQAKGNIGKNKHKSARAGFLLQVPRCQQVL